MNNLFMLQATPAALAFTAIGAAEGAFLMSERDSAWGMLAGAAVVGTAANVATGSILDLYGAIMPQEISSGLLRRTEVDASNATSTVLRGAQTSLNETIDSISGAIQRGELDTTVLRANLSKQVSPQFATMSDHDLMYALDAHAQQVSGDRRELLKFRDVIKNSNYIESVSGAQITPSTSARVSIGPNESKAVIRNKLRKHFRDVLNNPAEIAKEKAHQMAPVLEGKRVEIDDFTMKISVQGDNGPEVAKLALVGNTSEGSMFHRANGLDFPQRGINPYADLLQKGQTVPMMRRGVMRSVKVTTDGSRGSLNATKQYHADQLLGLTHLVNGDITDKEVLQIAALGQTTKLHAGNDSVSPIRMGDSHSVATAYAKRISGTIDLRATYKFVEDADTGARRLSLRPLGVAIEDGSHRSDFSRYLNIVTATGDHNPLEGQGMNSVGMISEKGAIEQAYTAGHMHAEDRGASTVNARSHVPINPADSAYLRSIEADTSGVSELRASASTGTRIHMSETLGEVIPDLFDDRLVFADGHGIANPAKVDLFTSRELTRISLGNMGDAIAPSFDVSLPFPTQATSSGSAVDMQALLQMDATERKLWLELNPVEINNSQIVGYSQEGKAARLAPHFTTGKLVSASPTEDGLDLVFDAKFVPHDSVKVFGVSSKSGLTFAENRGSFSLIGTMALGESRGMFASEKSSSGVISHVIKDESLGVLGQRVSSEALLGSFLDALEAGDKKVSGVMLEAQDAALIQRWSEVGQKDIQTVLTGAPEDITELITDLKESLRGQGMDKQIVQMKTALGDSYSEAGRQEGAAVLRAITVVSRKKAAQDIMMTAAEHATGTGDATLIRTARMLDSGSTGNTKNQMNDIIHLMRETFSQKEGTSYPLFSPSLGESINGAGNVGSMSWLESQQLLSTGMDADVIESMTAQDRGALYELSMVRNSDTAGNVSAKSFATGTDVAAAITSTIHVPAPERATHLKNLGLDQAFDEDTFVYTLKNPASGMQSVSIALEETGFSGPKQHAGKSIILPTEKLKSKVIAADIAVTNASTSAGMAAAQEALNRVSAELVDSYSSLVTKGSNLVKMASKRSAPGSRFLTARPIGGTADDFAQEFSKQAKIDGNNPLVGFVSKNTARGMYSDMGISNIEDHMHPTGTPGISRLVMPSGEGLMSQVSREPAQGPGSSLGRAMFVSNAVDTSSDHYYLPKSEKIMHEFAYLDYDYDHVRVLPTLGLSSEQMIRYNEHNTGKVQALEDLIGVQERIKVKGNVNHMNVTTAFRGAQEQALEEMKAGELGRIRKVASPAVTKFVTELNLALDATPINGDTSHLAPRVLAHGLTENLLKSNHKSTSDSLRGPLEKIMESQTRFRSGQMTSGTYQRSIRNSLDEALGGNMDSAPIGQKRVYDAALTQLVSSHVQHDEYIAKTGQYVISNIRDGDTPFEKLQSNVQAKIQASSIPTKSTNIEVRAASKNMRSIVDRVSGQTAAFRSRNSPMIAMATAGLAGITLAVRDTEEQLAMTSPGGEKPEALQPLSNETAAVRKYNPQKHYDASVEARAESRPNFGSMDRALFGNEQPRVSINMNDTSGIY